MNRTKEVTTPFCTLLAHAIEDAELSKEDVAAETGVNLSTVYRVLGGAPVSKPKAIAIVRAVNKLAGRIVLSEADAMSSLGYEYTPDADDSNLTIVAISNYAADLPAEVQEDLLEITKALYRKYQK